jgi:hypothetical protein
MLGDQYLTMNPSRNNILLAYLGNYGSSYASNNKIPNPWTMVLNPYYLGNVPLIFSNTIELVAYSFMNTMSTKIVATRGSQGVQVSMMIPLGIAPTDKFSTENLVPYFQLPT